ncbi:DUF6531 domain-containing protein [Acidovorax sp.]|uniref:DUF6531 domain-containing protein n=1 Tax=Acidovorax sp. TaxID=1872122 RepID=UPI002ACDA61E|nr:DUF6531 domain-containing protein [Acidovorax sp.]MDZ7864375.1 DUF6531 domain-containing protein [Acidovorax sp.]
MHGGPIFAPTREKIKFAQDLSDSGPMPLEFRRMYRSHRARDKSIWFNEYFQSSPGHLGDGWLHNHEIYLAVAKRPEGVVGVLDQVRVQMGDGTFHYFYRKPADLGYTARSSTQSLTKVSSSPVAWVLTDGKSDVKYSFDSEGRLIEQSSRNGWRLTYAYSGGKLSLVQNQFGRSLQLSYSAGKLSGVSTSDQRSVAFSYTNGILTGVLQADGTSIQYTYASPGAGIPALLTGIVDENGVAFASYTYDAEGWATSTEKAGGVERYSVPSKTQVIDPLGTSRSYSHKIYNNELVFQGASQPPASAGEAPIYTGSINATSGLVDFYYDQRYQQTTYTWDVARRLPLTVTEAVGKPESRTTSTTWHAQWRLPVIVTEPGRTTSYTYDTSGNVLTQTITDTGSGGTARTTTRSYNAAGLVATEASPNGAVTSYSYDALGNLTQSTNALGHVDTYTHDGAGRVLTHTAPSGLVVSYTYDAAGRMRTSNRGGQGTTLTYRPTDPAVKWPPPRSRMAMSSPTPTMLRNA